MGTVSPGGELDTPGCLFEMKAKVNTQRSRHTRVVLFDVAQSEQEARERKEGCAPRKWEQRLLSATRSLPRSPTRFPTPPFSFSKACIIYKGSKFNKVATRVKRERAKEEKKRAVLAERAKNHGRHDSV